MPTHTHAHTFNTARPASVLKPITLAPLALALAAGMQVACPKPALAQQDRPPADNANQPPAPPLVPLIEDPGVTPAQIPADDETPPFTRETDLDAFRFRLSANAAFHLNADLEDEGDLSVTRLNSGFDISAPLGNRARISFGAAAEFSFYDFDGATGLDPANGDPWDDIYQYDVNLFLNGTINPQWGWFAGGGLSIAAESGSSASDALTFRGFGGATYNISSDLTVGFGVGVFERLEDSTLVIPIPTIRWRISERTELASGGQAGIQGLGLRLTHNPNERWAVWGQGRFVGRDFRLDDDGPIPEGVGRDTRVELSIGTTYKVSQNLEFRARVGVDVWTEIETVDRNGDSLDKENIDPSLLIGVGLTATF